LASSRPIIIGDEREVGVVATRDPFGVRLDADVWTPTALGTVGPHGLLTDLGAGGHMSYRPLLTYHRRAGPIADGLDRAVELVEDAEALRAVLAAPDVAQWRHPGGAGAVDDDQWERDRKAAVIMRDRRGEYFQGLLVGGLERLDQRIAHLSTFWVPNAAWLRAPGADDILSAGWLMLFRALADRGAVGVTASETWSGRDYVAVLRNIAGFRPTAELCAELGLSPADAKAVLAEWRATCEGRQLVRFATRPELDEPAHHELIRLLDAYFGAMPPRTPTDGDPVPGERLTLGGDIAIDGVRGWGTGFGDDDWFDAPPNDIPEGADWRDADTRAHIALTDWLRHQRGRTA
jgi:hypothetical protein